jgi:Ran GTPase-activating protein 1
MQSLVGSTANRDPDCVAEEARPGHVGFDPQRPSFCLQGEREKIDAERARALFTPLRDASIATTSGTEADPSFERVSLSGKSFDVEAAGVAAEHIALLRPGSVRYLQLADVIAGQSEIEALQVLELLAAAFAAHQVVELDLSDNALGAKGVRACAALFQRSERLESLILCNNGLAADAIKLIVDALTGSEKRVYLKKLHLFNNLLKDEGALALVPLIERAPLLEDFRFASLRVSRGGSIAVAEALTRVAPTLRRLDMTDNVIGKDGAKALAQLLEQQTHLEELYLRDCLLTDAGARCILEALMRQTEQPRLRVLDLSGNELIGAATGSLLGKFLEHCAPTLTHLRLDENELGDGGALAIANALARDPQRFRLVELSLYLNDIGGRAAFMLVQRCVRIASMCVLNLNGNRLGCIALEHIERLVAGTPLASSFVDLDENNESEDEDATSDIFQQLRIVEGSDSAEAEAEADAITAQLHDLQVTTAPNASEAS